MVELTALRKEVGEMRSIEQELKEARSELMLARLSLKNAAAKLGKSGGVAGHRRRNLLHAEETGEGDRVDVGIWDVSRHGLDETKWNT